MGNAKIFIRERRKVSEGEKKPRYSVVGVAGTDLKTGRLFLTNSYFVILYFYAILVDAVSVESIMKLYAMMYGISSFSKTVGFSL